MVRRIGGDEESWQTRLDATRPSLPSPEKSPTAPTLMEGPVEPENVVRWNTENLGLRLGADASSAAGASILVAPAICVIDRSIVEKAASGKSLSSCLMRSVRPALTRPHTFLASKPFLLIFSLYFGTYFTANGIDTLTTTVQSEPASKVTSGPVKFVATSAVNMSLCVYKDSCFAKLFGGAASKSPAATIPVLSLALFSIRDSMTIFASFNLPPLIAPQLANLPPTIETQFSRILSTEAGRYNTAQFIAPITMQIFSTPIHLLGLDLYNRQGRLGIAERVTRIVRDWGVSASARMCRAGISFGLGGVINADVRRKMMKSLQ